MPVTITLQPKLSNALRSPAKARSLSVEQWAISLLRRAANQEDTKADPAETWEELNTRRLALIRKEYESGLNQGEKKELAKLQEAAAKIFEPADRRRRKHVQNLMGKAGGLHG